MSEEYVSLKFISPQGVAVFPKLAEPDTRFKPEGEYTCKLRLPVGEFDKLVDNKGGNILEQLTTIRDEYAATVKKQLVKDKKGAKAKALKVREILTPETDKDSGEETGNILINAKMRASGVSKKTNKPWKRSPKVFDSKGVVLKKVPNVWGGSEVKVAIEAQPYFVEKDAEVGITFRLEAVQIIKLVSGGGQSASDYGFGEEEGYEGEREETFGGDSETDDKSDATSGSDF